MKRRAKIVATIGPASDSEETLEALILAGMNVARLNFSHGTHEEHAERIKRIRRVAKRMGHPVGILQDLQGPKLRIGQLEDSLQLSEGERVHFYATKDKPPQTGDKVIPVDFVELFETVRKDDRLLLDDGRLSLRVKNIHARSLEAVVVVGGALTSHKGINLPGVRLRFSGYTSKDKADLQLGVFHSVDAVALSFVRTAKDVVEVREEMERFSNDYPAPMLIAKLERPEAIDNIDEILGVVDGVMVARGDLGVEMPPERVPVLQKMIIRKASARAKIVITATQMLESMIHSSLPTRAEASDIANAIFDGTDAVMLSAETAAGEHPVEAVKMMARIIVEAESHSGEWEREIDRVRGLGESDAASMSRAAYALASDVDVTAVAVFTSQGSTAWLVSKIRPAKRILAFTPIKMTYQKMAFLWGVYPQLVPFANTLEKMIAHVDKALLKSGVKEGGQVALLCGFPVGAMKPPNMALLHTVGDAH
ncbi:MAG: pyruvate kinase [Chloroflexi bacterium]|nr:pyruvate kinase [Chloroflexota bacterium]